MWTGTVVHGIAERALRHALMGLEEEGKVTEWSLEAMQAAAQRTVNEDIDGSASGRWLARPSRRTGFAEHYYKEPVSRADWDAAADEIRRQVQNLHAHRIYRRLLVTASRIVEMEELRRFPVGDPAMRAEVYLAVDVMVGDGHGGVVIIDWKTGESHDDGDIAAQLGVYGLYATQQLGVPEDRVVAMHVNLRHGTETRHVVGPAEIAAAREVIGRETQEMRATLADPVANIANKEDFPPIAEGDRRCRYCNFRRSCGREGSGTLGK